MAVHPPRYSALIALSLCLLACRLYISRVEENTALVNTLPPPIVSVQASTPISTQVPTPTRTPEPTLVPTSTPAPSFAKSSNVMAFITAPKGRVAQAYVILSAYGGAPENPITEISGRLGPAEFVCPGAQCLLPVYADSIITFQARTRSGESSEVVSATIRRNWSADGYTVWVESLFPVVIFSDYCSSVWELEAAPRPSWAVFPQSPMELSTSRELHYLAGQLIANGVVNAEDCPGSGLTPSGPNTCGLERAAQAMLDWQNQYDYHFWQAGKEQGVPPILLKTLIGRESQYWPMSQRFFLDEYGLAQINELGADVALRWDMNLYQDICNQTLLECPASYYRLRSSLRAMLRGTLLQKVYADCPTCSHGVDMTKALESIPINALILRYNCNDVHFVLDKYDYSASYEDYWKFTMVAYHSGINCLDFAIHDVARAGWDLTWSQVADKLRCTGSREYVETFWDDLEAFQTYQLTTDRREVGGTLAVLLPTQTPAPTPTVALSQAKIRVQVYVDVNGNDLPEAAERVNGILVLLEFPDSAPITSSTTNGEAVFDLSGYPVNMGVKISLPDFYRSQWLTLPAEGELLVTFKFASYPLPTVLP